MVDICGVSVRSVSSLDTIYLVLVWNSFCSGASLNLGDDERWLYGGMGDMGGMGVERKGATGRGKDNQKFVHAEIT